MQTEGVIKFEINHTDSDVVDYDKLDKLCRWRDSLRCLELTGQDPNRYGGLGFGNVSTKCGNGFLISGTQTGGIQSLKREHFSLVESWDFEKNYIKSSGPIKPSSESLTHAAVYTYGPPEIEYVVHAHSPEIWTAAKRDGSLRFIDEGIDYGTPEMAQAVADLFTNKKLKSADVFVMLGHEDGIVSFGRTAAEAASIVSYMLMVVESGEHNV